MDLIEKTCIDEKIIKVIEQYLELNFPTPYKDFLKKYNKEKENKNFFFKENQNDGSVLDSLFGLIPNSEYNVLVYYRDFKDRIPWNMFPIGIDVFGNLILISVKTPDRGKIYFWDHEMEADPDQGEVPDYSNLTLIADSFSEFMENLQDEIDFEE